VSGLLVAHRALGLGDLLTAVPALRALARAFPAHRRVLAAPRALAPLAALIGAVDELVDVAALAPLPERLHGADVAVNLHGRGPESHRLLLAARPRRLIAFACPAAGVDGPPWRADEHEVARWCRLLAAAGVAADPDDLELAAPATPAPAAAAGATVLHPGAASGARRWPAARWAQVARAERAAGRRVVLTGSPGEAPLAAGIARAAGLPPSAVLAGRTDLLGLAATVAAAGRVACGDTGVAHLATALRVPSVVLFGPTPPAWWGPPPGRPWHRALWAGRRGDPHAAAPDPGLLEIAVEDVAGALAALPVAPARVGAGHGNHRPDQRAGLMESGPQESDTGYPEEQPAEVADQPGSPGGTPQRDGGKADRKHPGSENEDEGTATGNPNAAGSSS
jgi:ADP-heptose:LPS heptosyltransferase